MRGKRAFNLSSDLKPINRGPWCYLFFSLNKGGGGKTYLSEFCAHEDEENESQELARRLHLLPPVCAEQRSHMQVGSLCVHPARQSVPPGSVSLTLLVFLWLLLPSYYSIPQKPGSRKICLRESSVCIFSSHRRRSSLPLPVALRGRTYLSLRRTVLNIGRANTVPSYERL